MDKPKRIAVIGAGSMGSQAMWRLAAHGAEVVGYDRYAQHVLPKDTRPYSTGPAAPSAQRRR
jgi:phosphoglycerate dehydrogenase-like enzyme